MFATKIRMSICTYQDGRFEVMIRDPDTGKEIVFEGKNSLTDQEFDFVNSIAPACVWTDYERITPKD